MELEEELDEDRSVRDLVFVTEVPYNIENGSPSKSFDTHVTKDTKETEDPDYDFDVAFGAPVAMHTVPESQPVTMNEDEPVDPEEARREATTGDGSSKYKDAREFRPALLTNPRKKKCLIMTLTVVLIGAGVALGVIFGTSSPGEETRGSGNVATSSPPQKNGTITFEDVAVKVFSSEEDYPTDQSSSKYKAIQFMVQENGGDYMGDEERIRQRFAVATLGYALGGPSSWLFPLDFLVPEKHECDWNWYVGGLIMGVVCLDGRGIVQYISIPGNELKGTLPEELAILSDLDYLDLSYNNIGGPIPDELAGLTMLQRLSLNSNQLTGSVDVIASSSRLQHLSIQSNLLTGDLSLLCSANVDMSADCLGESAEVICSCCSSCCDSSDVCQTFGR